MPYKSFRERYVFWGLFISLLLSFTVTPLFDESVRPFNIFILSSLCLSVLAVGTTKVRTAIGLLLGIPFFIVSLLSSTHDGAHFLIGFYTLAALFFLYIIAMLLQSIFMSNRVDTNRLLSSISVYLCIGIVWSMFYGLVDLYIPGSFRIGSDVSLNAHINDLMYFSIVSLTTLGYGDITPLSSIAKSLAAVEALVGQIYLTVLVARLVGLHIAGQKAID